METMQLACKECGFEKLVGEGTTKIKFYQDGLWGKVFFCKKSKEFVHLQIVSNQEMFEKSKIVPKGFEAATPTTQTVDLGSKYKIYNHSSCSNALIPLDYYRSQKNPVCPICSKGTLSIKTLSFSD